MKFILFFLSIFFVSSCFGFVIETNENIAIGSADITCKKDHFISGFCSDVYKINDTHWYFFDITPNLNYCEIKGCNISNITFFDRKGNVLQIKYTEKHNFNWIWIAILVICLIIGKKASTKE